MIRRLKINDRKETHYDAFEDPDVLPSNEVRFADGVNIVIGPSGSGKSALLNFLARLLHCSTGFQFVSVRSRELIQYGFPKKTITGFEFDHDGSPARYYNPLSYKVNRNHGEVPRRNISALFGSLPAKIDLSKEKPSVYGSYIIGDGTAVEDSAVYLIDSPETGMSIEQIVGFCSKIGEFGSFLAESGYVPKVQVIIATNHPWIMGIKNANIIETHKDYLLKYKSISRKVSDQLFT